MINNIQKIMIPACRRVIIETIKLLITLGSFISRYLFNIDRLHPNERDFDFAIAADGLSSRTEPR